MHFELPSTLHSRKGFFIEPVHLFLLPEGKVKNNPAVTLCQTILNKREQDVLIKDFWDNSKRS